MDCVLWSEITIDLFQEGMALCISISGVFWETKDWSDGEYFAY